MNTSTNHFNQKTLKVFVVDDDPIYLELFEKKMSLLGKVKISTFESAESCLKAMHRKPDVIFMDFYLDGEKEENMNGLFALQDIMQMDPNQKVVMMSSESNADMLNTCLEQGATDYMVKNGINLNIGVHLTDSAFTPMA